MLKQLHVRNFTDSDTVTCDFVTWSTLRTPHRQTHPVYIINYIILQYYIIITPPCHHPHHLNVTKSKVTKSTKIVTKYFVLRPFFTIFAHEKCQSPWLYRGSSLGERRFLGTLQEEYVSRYRSNAQVDSKQVRFWTVTARLCRLARPRTVTNRALAEKFLWLFGTFRKSPYICKRKSCRNNYESSIQTRKRIYV